MMSEKLDDGEFSLTLFIIKPYNEDGWMLNNVEYSPDITYHVRIYSLYRARENVVYCEVIYFYLLRVLCKAVHEYIIIKAIWA